MSPVVIIVHESFRESLKSDLASFALAFALIGLGVLLNSDAMQWFGFGCVILFLGSRTMAIATNKKMRLTVEEARARLDELECEFQNK